MKQTIEIEISKEQAKKIASGTLEGISMGWNNDFENYPRKPKLLKCWGKVHKQENIEKSNIDGMLQMKVTFECGRTYMSHQDPIYLDEDFENYPNICPGCSNDMEEICNVSRLK